MIKFLKLWAPVIVWATIIFQFSASPTAPIEPTTTTNIVIRKFAHVSEYVILFYLIARALRSPKKLPLALAITIFYAFSDETHQLFTPDRSARLSDVLFFDLAGLLPFWYILKRFPKLLDIYV